MGIPEKKKKTYLACATIMPILPISTGGDDGEYIDLAVICVGEWLISCCLISVCLGAKSLMSHGRLAKPLVFLRGSMDSSGTERLLKRWIQL